MGKVIFVYYSYEGSTRRLAEAMAESLKADLLELRPKKEMKTMGFGKYIWGGGQVVMGRMPELEPFEKDLEAYDLLFIGTPVWAFSYAPPIKALIEGGLIKHKRVAFFCCHEGGPGKTLERAKAVLEKDNRLVGTMDFFNPKNNLETCLREGVAWAGEIVQSLK